MSSQTDNASPGANRIVGQGVMQELVRQFPWQITPLGTVDTWSETLVAFVNHTLNAPLPLTLTWGPEYITFYNDAAIDTMGAKHPWALGVSYARIFAEAWNFVGREMDACFHEGRTVVHENIMTPVTRGGAIEDHYWTYSRVPIFDRGVIAGVLIPHRNTTETVMARRERDSMAARMNQFLEATKDAIVGVDRDWRISYLNPTAEKLYANGRAVVGCRLWEEFPAAAYPGSPYVEHYTRAMDEGTAAAFEAHHPAPANVWIEVEVYPTAEGIVIFSRDISEKRKAEEALMQSEKLAVVGRMASSIAHEINNPLESVTNLLYIARHTRDKDEVDRMLDLADSELRRVAVITNQTLRFHRQASHPQDITALDLLDTVLTMFEGKLRNSRITVQQRIRTGKPVRVFEGDIRQVLNNLVSNAVDAMPLGGRLLVRSRETLNHRTGEPGVVFTLADSGPGMPAEVLSRVFEAFYSTKGIGGSGLGLWISREIVDRHGGALRLRSSTSAQHHGTVATLFVPFDAALQEDTRPSA